ELRQVKRAEPPAASQAEQGGGVGPAEAAVGAERQAALREALEPRGQRADDAVLERRARVVDARPERRVAVLGACLQQGALDRVPVGEQGAQAVAHAEGVEGPGEDRAAVVAGPEFVAGAEVELEEALVVADEAGGLQEAVAEERAAAGVPLVVVEV